MTYQFKVTKLIRPAFLLPFVIAFTITGNIKAAQVNTPDIQNIRNIRNNEDSVYSIAEKMPEYPGGEIELITFINKAIKYPAKAVKNKEEGKVVVQFVVNKTGKVENAKILRSVSPNLDKEALRVIGLLPDWTPAENGGTKVDVYQIIPVSFKIPVPYDENTWEVNDKTVIVIDGVQMPANFNVKILNPSKLASANAFKPFPKEEEKRLKDKYGKQAENGVLLITTNKDDIYYALADTLSSKEKEKIAGCKDSVMMPSFPGGKENMFKYINDSIQYPFIPKELKTQGIVTVRFLVDNAGKVSNASIMKKLDYYLDKEALRVINAMPDWFPAAKCDLKLNIYVTIPVTFKLDLPASEKGWEKNDKTVILMDGERMPSSFDIKLLNYSDLSSYKVFQPGTKAENKKLVAQYGKDAVNGVIVIVTRR
jgi:TonB family protein